MEVILKFNSNLRHVNKYIIWIICNVKQDFCLKMEGSEGKWFYKKEYMQEVININVSL